MVITISKMSFLSWYYFNVKKYVPSMNWSTDYKIQKFTKIPNRAHKMYNYCVNMPLEPSAAAILQLMVTYDPYLQKSDGFFTSLLSFPRNLWRMLADNWNQKKLASKKHYSWLDLRQKLNNLVASNHKRGCKRGDKASALKTMHTEIIVWSWTQHNNLKKNFPAQEII